MQCRDVRNAETIKQRQMYPIGVAVHNVEFPREFSNDVQLSDVNFALISGRSLPEIHPAWPRAPLTAVASVGQTNAPIITSKRTSGKLRPMIRATLRAVVAPPGDANSAPASARAACTIAWAVASLTTS